MNRAKEIFRLIQHDVPGMVLCNDMLVVAPTEHIVRGFLLEATMLKDHAYLWRVVTPLYRPMSRVFLDYSNRIPNGERIYINRKALSNSAEGIRPIICDNVLFLQNVRRPSDFLQHIAWMAGNPDIRFRFDFALTHYRVGNVDQSKKLLRELDREVDRLEDYRRLPVDSSIKLAAEVIADDPAKLGLLLDKWESENVERLGLQATRAATAAQ
jgi:hypothetical protein